MMLDNYRLADQASQPLVHGNNYDENPKNPNCSERLDETIVLPAHTGDSLSSIPALWISLGF